jgi:hypothetical protein
MALNPFFAHQLTKKEMFIQTDEKGKGGKGNKKELQLEQ